MFGSPNLTSYFLSVLEKEQKSYLGTTSGVKLIFISLVIFIEIML